MASHDDIPQSSTTAARQPDPIQTSSILAVQQIQQRDDVISSSTPVEMSQLDSPRSPEVERWTTPPTSTNGGSDYLEAAPTHETAAATSGQQETARETTTYPPSEATAPVTQQSIIFDSNGSSSAPLDPPTANTIPPSSESPAIKPEPVETSPIGPSAQDPATVITSNVGITPGVPITLLLTTGARHPFRIDQKYLQKRNITTRGDDPFAISVYTMKELIWRDWRDEWDLRPTSPSAIRLIHFGKLLDDKHSLKDCRFVTDAPNVVHMTVKPADLQDDDDHTKKGMSGRGDGDDEGRRVGCRCCVLM